MSSSWYLVYTKAKKEHEAQHHLCNQGFNAYLPKHCVSARKKGRYVDSIEVLFPRYLFVELHEGVDDYSPIRSTRGVVGLVRFGMRPSPVPLNLIEFLKQNEKEKLAPKPLIPFKAGDKISVIDGPFAGYDAIYQSDKGEDRALILLELMSQFSRVTLPVHNLAAAVA